MNAPIVYQWSGEAMVPLPRYHNRCGHDFVVGAFYQLEQFEERSKASHDHFFAQLADLHGTLHENLKMEFPTVAHLRKFALIRCGFHKESKFVLASHDEAMRLATMMGEEDEFAVVGVSGNVVTRYTARSQLARGKDAMDKADFQASKTAVLDYVARLIGVAPPTATRLRSNMGERCRARHFRGNPLPAPPATRTRGE